MKRKPAPPSPEVVANMVRNHWRSIVTATCLRNAQLLNVVPRDAFDLRSLPSDLAEMVAHKCVELCDEATREELQLGSRPARLEQRVNTELWRTLKVFRNPPAGEQRGLL